MPKIDAVLGTETNSLMGGVAAFNHQLAKRLGVPVRPLGWPGLRRPLISIKASGVPDGALVVADGQAPDVFFHDWHNGCACLTKCAERVFAANTTLAEQIRPIRHDVITAHCPGLIEHRGAFPHADITVFSFGHGHKLRVDLYAKLHALLEATGRSYTVFLSAGLHTGARVVDDPFLALERLFGDHLIFLGILSDRAVAHYLATCTYVAQFFEHGVRENNTTVNAALDAGACVITNCDAHTPDVLRRAVCDVTRGDPRVYAARIRRATRAHSWKALLEKLG